NQQSEIREEPTSEIQSTNNRKLWRFVEKEGNNSCENLSIPIRTRRRRSLTKKKTSLCLHTRAKKKPTLFPASA
ncbi:hypothetical protein PIB30_042478, partial [Stylosanthes scabra]|nr:hypothetical protein [Stylosanthes scabra]